MQPKLKRTSYDISDYKKVNPIYGSLDDIDLLVSKAHEKGLKVILDIALNHTSTEVRDFESQFKYRGQLIMTDQLATA